MFGLAALHTVPSQDLQSVIGRCQMDAMKIHAHMTKLDDQQAAEGAYVIACMKARGYDVNFGDQCSSVDFKYVPITAKCYHAR